MQAKILLQHTLLFISYNVFFIKAQLSVGGSNTTDTGGLSPTTFSFPVISLEQAVAPPDGSLTSRAATGHPQFHGTAGLVNTTNQRTVYPIPAENAALLALYRGAHQYALDQWNQGHIFGDVNGDYYRFTSNDMSLIVEATGEAAQDATNLDWGQYASIAEGMYNYTKASPSLATTLQGYLQMDDGTRGADVLTTVSIVDVPLQNTGRRRHRRHRRSYGHNNLQPRDQWSSVGLSANYKMAWRSSPTRVAAKLIANVVLSAWGAILGDWNIDKSSYEYYKHSDINPQRGGGGAAVFEIATTGAVQITREILEDMMNELLLLQAQGKWANRGGDIPALEGTILDEMDQTIARWTLGTALPAAARGVRNYLCENPDGSRAVACFAKGM